MRYGSPGAGAPTPRRTADVSAVIGWALAHTPADEDKIGMAGVSYGAGLSLLASGHDKRIKADPRQRRVRSTAILHTRVTSTKESGTLVAYLYDVGPLGLGKLVSNAPYTFHGQEPGRPFPVDLELNSTAYEVPAGHRLALVVDTVDPLYIEHNPSGAQLTFSSPAADPSFVSVPLRNK
ncbi:CocE/NonD family hydrolase C-terminal non-catalytic domain-containing protein [Streptomyces sp. NPDC048442]|uniref:CocE/NonD family hydrolase C-terminal non-catalytic domain-containing protein n=1 Tax=Streptomyces sp. NPDC048442 TaxID=3154823 RepID=UPI00341940FF